MGKGTTTIIKSDDGLRVFVEHMPGNGTRYVGMSAKIPASVPHYGGKWLVAFPEFPGSSWHFEEGCVAFPSYVAEKLGVGRHSKLGQSEVDTHELCKLIAMLVPNATHAADTDETGHFPEHRLLSLVE